MSERRAATSATKEWRHSLANPPAGGSLVWTHRWVLCAPRRRATPASPALRWCDCLNTIPPGATTCPGIDCCQGGGGHARLPAPPLDRHRLRHVALIPKHPTIAPLPAMGTVPHHHNAALRSPLWRSCLCVYCASFSWTLLAWSSRCRATCAAAIRQRGSRRTRSCKQV